MTSRRLAAVLMVSLAAVSSAACGSDDYDREDFISELKDSGIPEQQAVCIADGVEDRIDVKLLEDQDKLSEEDQRVIAEVTLECVGLGADGAGAPFGE